MKLLVFWIKYLLNQLKKIFFSIDKNKKDINVIKTLKKPKTNIPYVKKYDENGELLNPIEGKYTHEHPNRRKRRLIVNKSRPFRNRNNYPTIIKRNGLFSFVKYHPKYQYVDGKWIVH